MIRQINIQYKTTSFKIVSYTVETVREDAISLYRSFYTKHRIHSVALSKQTPQ